MCLYIDVIPSQWQALNRFCSTCRWLVREQVFLYLTYFSSEPRADILTWDQDIFIPKSMTLTAINTSFFVVVVLGLLQCFKEKGTVIVPSMWFKWLSILYFFGFNDFSFLRKTDNKKLHASVDLNLIQTSGCVGILQPAEKVKLSMSGRPSWQS